MSQYRVKKHLLSIDREMPHRPDLTGSFRYRLQICGIKPASIDNDSHDVVAEFTADPGTTIGGIQPPRKPQDAKRTTHDAATSSSMIYVIFLIWLYPGDT